MTMLRGLLLPLSLVAASPACAAAPVAPALVPALDRAAVEGVVDAFHRALKEGNREAALALLADDVLILEGGGAERSKAEYAAHHLDADMAFTKAVPGTVTRRFSSGDPSTAWVATEGRTKGEFRGRAMDKISAETMVLRNGPDGWRIVHIHWSSADPH